MAPSNESGWLNDSATEVASPMAAFTPQAAIAQLMRWPAGASRITTSARIM